MASRRNQHCATCIGTLSFPISGWLVRVPLAQKMFKVFFKISYIFTFSSSLWYAVLQQGTDHQLSQPRL